MNEGFVVRLALLQATPFAFLEDSGHVVGECGGEAVDGAEKFGDCPAESEPERGGGVTRRRGAPSGTQRCSEVE